MQFLRAIRALLVPKLNVVPASHAVPVAPMGTRIPHILHQTFPTRELPAALQANVDALRAMNPGWEYRFYDDADVRTFVSATYGPAMVRAIERFTLGYGAAKADLFRYLLLYHTGGVYLDIKSATTRPLDEVLRPDDVFVLANWRNNVGGRYRRWGMHADLPQSPRGEFQQWHVIAAPGHPFLRAVIANVLRNQSRYLPAAHGVGRKGTMRVSGPIAYTLAIQPLLDQHPHRRVDNEEELGMQYTIFPKSRDHGKLFERHYARLEEPVVRLSATQRLHNRLLLVAKRLRDDAARLVTRTRPSSGTPSGTAPPADAGQPPLPSAAS